MITKPVMWSLVAAALLLPVPAGMVQGQVVVTQEKPDSEEKEVSSRHLARRLEALAKRLGKQDVNPGLVAELKAISRELGRGHRDRHAAGAARALNRARRELAAVRDSLERARRTREELAERLAVTREHMRALQARKEKAEAPESAEAGEPAEDAAREPAWRGLRTAQAAEARRAMKEALQARREAMREVREEHREALLEMQEEQAEVLREVREERRTELEKAREARRRALETLEKKRHGKARNRARRSAPQHPRRHAERPRPPRAGTAPMPREDQRLRDREILRMIRAMRKEIQQMRESVRKLQEHVRRTRTL